MLDEVDVKPLVMVDVAVGAGAVGAVGVEDVVGAVTFATGSGGGGTGLVVVGDEAVDVVDEVLVDVDVVPLDVDVELVDDELEVVEDVEVDVAGAGGGATGVVAVVVDEALVDEVDVPEPPVDFSVSVPAPPLNTTGMVDCRDTA